MDFTWLNSYLPFVWGALFGLGATGILYGIFTRPLRRRLEHKVEEREDQFVALASHYLRTPITVIQISLSRLQDGNSELNGPAREKLYDSLARGTQRLLLLADQLTTVGAVDQQQLTAKPSVVNLVDVAADAIAFVDPFARPKEIRCQLKDMSTDLPQLRCDAKLVKQAIVALLDNAVKFSPEKSEVMVTVGHQAGIYYVQVQDEGTGMPQDTIAHMSEKFYRGTSLYDFDYEGLGLGLHIAQAVASLHGGTVTFQSIPKRGTVAILQLSGI